jgi:hypothetical protein
MPKEVAPKEVKVQVEGAPAPAEKESLNRRDSRRRDYGSLLRRITAQNECRGLTPNYLTCCNAEGVAGVKDEWWDSKRRSPRFTDQFVSASACASNREKQLSSFA